MEKFLNTVQIQPPADVFKHIAEGTYDWESFFARDGRLLWVNPAVERLTGYTVKECMALEDYPLALVFPDDRGLVEDVLKSVHTGRSGNDCMFRIIHKNGTVFWVSVSWQTIYGHGGELLGLRTSVRDISAHKQAEETLQKALEDVQRANDAKSRFLAAASHDLRQPLHAVRMFVSTLKLVLSGNEDAQELVNNIEEGLDSSQEILNALLDISRLEAGMMVPQKSAFELKDCLDGIVHNATPLARQKGLELRYQPCSYKVVSDSAMLTRVLRNIVFNAIHYTNSGGLLVGCRRRGNIARISVWDTGIGIEEDQLANIFEEFYQIGNPERDRRRGLGLGLAIVKRIAGLLDHEIAVRSVPGKGTCFSISVPLADKNKKRKTMVSHRSQNAVRLSGLTLMAIDDDPLQLSALSGLLRKLGADTMRASGPAEAVELLRRTSYRPDMVIADLRLKGKSTGIDAVRLVRRTLGEDIPALILTGDTAPSRLKEAASAGLELLHKPVTGERLAATVRNMLSVYL